MAKRTGYDTSVMWAVLCLMAGFLVILAWEVGHNSRDVRHLKSIVKPGFAAQYGD